jgi:peptide/nickel transport system substrate-binding protein
VTFAEGAAAPPNYIFPLMSGAYFAHYNTWLFDYLMYRPLYWFGQNGEPVLNESLSLAKAPVFSDNNTVASVTLKHWMWSDGKPITARDVIFWMNLLTASLDPKAPTIGSSTAPGPGWGAAVPGAFPENVVSYTQTGTYTVTFKLNASYNPTWYLYNELSQISPLPQASWDMTSAQGAVGDDDAQAQSRVVLTGSSLPSACTATALCYVPSNPGTATSGALGVAQFLNSQSQELTTFATNPLWQVVDGPFRLTQFTADGYAKMVPNKAYSGLPKAKISAFEELPFTSDSAEFNSLRSGTVTLGYLPVQDIDQKTSIEKSEHYTFKLWYSPTVYYFPYNFTNPVSGPIFKQLYFRQAFQSLVNQKEYIKEFSDGLGLVTNGPVPEYPKGNPDESKLEENGEVYSYDPAKSVSLLKDNGWTVKPGGSTVCSKPGTAAGDCGAGIGDNQPLTFGLLYASGITELTDEMEALQSTMKQEAGIVLNLKQQTASEVISTAFGCSPATPCTDWALADWGGGWNYNPDNLPTGGELFETGAASNAGDYSNATDNANIAATHVAPTHAAEISALFKYENYLAKQLPVVWVPEAPEQLTMYSNRLKGVLSIGVAGFKIYPEYYSLAKS